MTNSGSRVLIVSNDVVGASMAGPGIRYWEIAKALSKEFGVTLAVPGEGCREFPGVCVRGYSVPGAGEDGSLVMAELASKADVILVAGSFLPGFPALAASSKPLIVDLYTPFYLENLELARQAPDAHAAKAHLAGLDLLSMFLKRGDFFLCASERQRDLLLGMLAIANRINPLTYKEDRSLRNLVGVVPFGLESRPPKRSERALRGVYPGIGLDDKVILWGGGIWQWLDPLTSIRAMQTVAGAIPEAKLFFPGTRHPNRANVPEMDMTREAINLSKDLGLYGRHVFFNEWTPYDARVSYLLESDVGISLHFDGVETRFAFRTRILDYIWAGLPMVVTEGDYLSELVAASQLGRVVKPGDIRGVADSLIELLRMDGLRSVLTPKFANVAKSLTWEKAVAQLVQFLRNPARAADRRDQATALQAGLEEVGLLTQRLHERDAQILALKELISGYERGKVMRVMNMIGGLRQRLAGRNTEAAR